MFDPRVTALEYAVVFLLEQEEKKLLEKEEHTTKDMQKLAQLEDLRAELQLHMKAK
jgi:hypothetical protein